MRKGNRGEENREENGEENIEEKTDENSGHYVIASSRPPEWRPLERRTLVPIAFKLNIISSRKFDILKYFRCPIILYEKTNLLMVLE